MHFEGSYLSNPPRGSLQYLARRRFGDRIATWFEKVGEVGEIGGGTWRWFTLVTGSHRQGRPPRVFPLVHGSPDRLASEI